jgi:hypothetical protein
MVNLGNVTEPFVPTIEIFAFANDLLNSFVIGQTQYTLLCW